MKPSTEKNCRLINCIRYSQDNSLMVLSTQYGYEIIETKSFRIISSQCQFLKNLIGNITLGTALYKSKLVFFVGKEDNKTYPNNQLTIWNDETNTPIGRILMKRKITYTSVTSLLIFIAIGISLYLFDIKRLKLITIVDAMYYNPYKEIPLCVTNSNVLAYINNEYNKENSMTKYVLLTKFKKTLSNRIAKQLVFIDTHFTEVQKVAISKDESIALVVSHYGNKIHIYSLATFQLKYCLFTGFNISMISSITFDSKGKYVLFITKKGLMQIYSISNISRLLLCDCDEHDDNLLFNKNVESTYLQLIFDKLTHKLFDNSVESYCEVQSNVQADNNHLLYVDFKRQTKDEIALLYNDGLIKQIKFNRKIKGSCWIDSIKSIYN